MQRNMDLVRELLLRLEGLNIPAGSAFFVSTNQAPLAHQGDDLDQIAYNMRLLVDAGFIDLNSTQGPVRYGVTGLSWRGHDFLDSVRDPAIWRETQEGVKKAGGFTVELIADLAKGLLKTQIEKHAGVKL